MQFPSLDAYRPKSQLVTPQTPVSQPAFPVFDAHMHFGEMPMGPDYPSLYDIDETVAALKAKGVFGVVNLDGGWGAELRRMLDVIGPHNDYISIFGTVPLERFEEPGFETLVYQTLRDSMAEGVRGLKFWKNLGLVIRDAQGRYLRPDDPRLCPVWQAAAEFHLPIVIHLADPVAFFDPLDVYNERYEELVCHPDWHFHGQGRYTFETLMACQEAVIAENPKTTFVVAHVGSYAENLRQVAQWLDAYDNMFVDIAARVAELGRQPYASKAFFEKYADRILFGTDASPIGMDMYETTYRFLETRDEYFSYGGGQGRWNIYGLGLAPDVLAKIYSGNAKRVLGIG